MDDLIRRVDALASIKALYPNMMPIIDIFDARRKWFEKNKPYFECENVIEQLPSVKQEPCEDTISRQNDILPNIDKKVESYKKVIKNPVVKSIMGMDEEQEQIDFVQSHKQIPVTLTVSGDLISREAVEEIINDIRNCISVEGYWAILERMKKLPPVKPQTGHWIMQHRKINTINYRTGEDVLTGEIHTVKELIRYECDEPYCSECGKRAGDTSGNYCCFCGARMESEQNG